jgi:hypothetical protein
MRILCAVVLLTAIAYGQNTTRVFKLTPPTTPQNLQEVVNAIRTITLIDKVYMQADAGAITVSGTADQVDLAAWLVNFMDTAPGGSTQRYTMAGVDDTVRSGGSQVRIFYVHPTATQRDLQDIINAVRTVADVARMYQYWKTHTIALRGTTGQVALAEWLVTKLDQPPTPGAPPAVFTAEADSPRQQDTAARVVYLSDSSGAEDIQRAVNEIRKDLQVMKIYPCFAARAVALRTTDAKASEAERMLAQH